MYVRYTIANTLSSMEVNLDANLFFWIQYSVELELEPKKKFFLSFLPKSTSSALVLSRYLKTETWQTADKGLGKKAQGHSNSTLNHGQSLSTLFDG